MQSDGDVFHVDAQFLQNALGVFRDLEVFEERARSGDRIIRGQNVGWLVDALDLCNVLVLGDRVVFDSGVGGHRRQRLDDTIDAVAERFRDETVASYFRDSFGGVAAVDDAASDRMDVDAARSATAFLPRLARCATNLLDLFHLPRTPPDDPGQNLMRFVDDAKNPSSSEIEAIARNSDITGRRFYAGLLSDETALRALRDANGRVAITEDVLALLFTNFRLRLAEQRSLSLETTFDGESRSETERSLIYLPAMGRRDFNREFSRFIRWGSDPAAQNRHQFDIGIREYVLEQWEDVGSQIQLSDRKAIPIVVASVLGSLRGASSRRPEALLEECLKWRMEHQAEIANIRRATTEFERLEYNERKEEASEYVAEILKAPSSQADARQRLGERLSIRDGWLGMTVRLILNPFGAPGTLTKLAIAKTDAVREHFQEVRSDEYRAAVHLSEAARPLLSTVGPETRQLLIDVFGGTVIDARNPDFDPSRFGAAA